MPFNTSYEKTNYCASLHAVTQTTKKVTNQPYQPEICCGRNIDVFQPILLSQVLLTLKTMLGPSYRLLARPPVRPEETRRSYSDPVKPGCVTFLWS
ncbi:hypothetical protein RRG08_031493 [Elysia crispata]|uniref:Uncharacterized protein n=1 Tax=Elysia crispata TaxID=231223 RepID=A0AAE1D762_9GAST|nr:hypothetical protein RRG08_031493 [Elysia crispata]